jgi:hypothetical protein
MTPPNHPDTLVESGYAPVNGLEMYYEIHGSGQPLVLLHGNLSTIETSFGNVLSPLASMRRIIAIEQQGHGHTADIDRPFSLRRWAEDTIVLLRHLGTEQADFFIMFMISYPCNVRHAVSSEKKPIPGFVNRLMKRWSCSIRLLRYFTRSSARPLLAGFLRLSARQRL